MFPTPIARETTTVVSTLAAWLARKATLFARKAPSKIPGHTRYPNNRTAATAIPDGGHTGDAFVLSRASRKLRPATP